MARTFRLDGVVGQRAILEPTGERETGKETDLVLRHTDLAGFLAGAPAEATVDIAVTITLPEPPPAKVKVASVTPIPEPATVPEPAVPESSEAPKARRKKASE